MFDYWSFWNVQSFTYKNILETINLKKFKGKTNSGDWILIIEYFQAAMHQAMAAAYPSSLVPNAVSHGGYSPGQLGSHGGRSPVSSPQPPPLSTSSQMGPYSSGQITPGANTHNTSGNDGGMSSDCSDDEGSPGGPGGGNVQIYPWMKKIHVAGAGKCSDISALDGTIIYFQISWVFAVSTI